jgi:hypothetical protein
VTDDERDDRAIARALGLDNEPSGPDGDADAYREVLAHLSDDVAPPAGLEDRVVDAALARRPAATTAISGAARRRRTRARVAGLSAAVAVVAGVVIAVLIANSASTTKPANRVEPIAVSRDDVARLAARPGARTGTLSNGLGHVVLAADGQGYVYDLTRSDPVAVWVDAGSRRTRLGAAAPQDGILGFRVGHADDVTAVELTTTNGNELGRAPLTAP